jgi:ABC-type bacteriocin/lantibiotic exporter with double-glycine peptidase domain
MAGLAADIEAMPMGMHSVLMEGASTLSGGQLQRLMIARALIGKPQILILDEATSALDNVSQAVVTESLNRLHATRIVIAHRLSTIRDADKIFVMERGRLVESGGFDALMAGDGTFAALARRQLL